jgi:hypothetical protein
VTDTRVFGSQGGTVSVKLVAQGNENALGFSLFFEPGTLIYTGASLGTASGATLNVNTDQLSAGRLGLALALAPGNTFAAGTEELVKVNFRAAASPGNYSVGFGDQPVAREVSDSLASTLAADYISGSVVINPLPTLRVVRSDQAIVLAWPSWATDFVLQQADGPPSAFMEWTSVQAAVKSSNGESVVTLPLDALSKFYRLKAP